MWGMSWETIQYKTWRLFPRLAPDRWPCPLVCIISVSLYLCNHLLWKLFSKCLKGASRGFSQNVFQGRAKSGEICFLPLKIQNQPYFAKNFKIQGRSPALPFWRPCPWKGVASTFAVCASRILDFSSSWPLLKMENWLFLAQKFEPLQSKQISAWMWKSIERNPCSFISAGLNFISNAHHIAERGKPQ